MSNILDLVGEILGSFSYKGILPDTPDTLTALFEYAGAPPEQYFGSIAYKYNIQVRTRARESRDAYSLAEAAQAALSGYYDDRLSIRQVSSIIGIGQDSKGRQEYTINFEISIK